MHMVKILRLNNICLYLVLLSFAIKSFTSYDKTTARSLFDLLVIVYPKLFFSSTQFFDFVIFKVDFLFFGE